MRNDPRVLESQLLKKNSLQVASALAYMHSLAWIHRDVKTFNILLLSDSWDPPFAKLADFGAARSASGNKTPGYKVGRLGG